MSSIPTTLFKSFFKDGGHVCFNNVVSILNRAYVKRTDDINRLKNGRSHTDGEAGLKT